MPRPQKKQIGGSWAKAIQTAANGTFSTTIPAGIFVGLPVFGWAVQTTGTRDYVFRLSTLTMDATTKVITVAGVVRQSQTLLVGGDSFAALTSAVTLHLSAEESD